jgi:phosphinothricin acetyltransferase
MLHVRATILTALVLPWGGMDVRAATPADLTQIAEIYATAATTSHVTFDLEGRPLSWWREVLARTDPAAGHELLVAADGDIVLGYARSSRHKEKPAYATTVETSVYVGGEHRARGIGRLLYAALLERLDASGLRLAVAGVALPNDASERLHRAHGFTEIGVFAGVGVKLGRAWDVRWFQRPLAGAPAL